MNSCITKGALSVAGLFALAATATADVRINFNPGNSLVVTDSNGVVIPHKVLAPGRISVDAEGGTKVDVRFTTSKTSLQGDDKATHTFVVPANGNAEVDIEVFEGRIKNASKPKRFVDRPGRIGTIGGRRGNLGGFSTARTAGPPANDDCSGAIAIGDGATAFSTIGATTDSPANGGACQFDGQTYNDVWYAYTASCTGTTTISTCGTAGYDTDLSVYSGSCGSLTLEACNDDFGGCPGFTSELSFATTSGTTYLIAVGGFADGDTGTGTLNVSCVGPPPGDECATANMVLCNSETTFNNSAASNSGPDQSCRAGGGSGFGSVWFSFVADDTTAQVDTELSAGGDSVISMYEGTCGSLTEIACSEDEGVGLLSTFFIQGLTVGETYYVQFQTFTAASAGEYTLRIQCPRPAFPLGKCCFPDGTCADEPELECLSVDGDWTADEDCATGSACPVTPANDDCANAAAAAPGDSLTFDNSAATDDAPAPCGVASGPFKNVWYSVTGTGNTMTATTCNAGSAVTDTKIAVYCGDCGAEICVAGNDDDCAAFAAFQSTVSWASQPGVEYLVTVGNFSAFTTPGAIQVDFSDDGVPAAATVNCLPTGACCLGGGSCTITDNVDCDNIGGDYLGDGVGCSTANAVTDGGFENGPGGGAWIEFSSNFGTPVCDAFSCGTGGGTGPNSGAFWTWFGGIAAPEEGHMEQLITIPAGSAQLSFFYELPALNSAAGAADFMNVRMDGDLLFNVDATATAFVGYALETIDVSAYADGGNHLLRFESEITGALGAVSNFFVDDVAVDNVQQDCR